MDNESWEMTIMDMLMLLLTFFIFFLSISGFKEMDYSKLWKKPPKQELENKAINLIKSIKMPVENLEAEQLVNEVSHYFYSDPSQSEGISIHYVENKISLMMSEEFSFGLGSIDITDNGRQFLGNLLLGLKQNKFHINLEGHTDNIQPQSFNNMDLSIRRAMTIAEFFLAGGIERQRVSVSGYGEYRPIASNDQPAERAKNRRIEINIIFNFH
jgi:chemotaxis protein MotB